MNLETFIELLLQDNYEGMRELVPLSIARQEVHGLKKKKQSVIHTSKAEVYCHTYIQRKFMQEINRWVTTREKIDAIIRKTWRNERNERNEVAS